MSNNMDSVFSMATEENEDFDVIFDQEDSLIDTVNGVNEAGDPLTGVDFEDLHQTQDDADVKDVKDVVADDNDMGAPNPEGVKDQEDLDTSVKGELDKESDADKFHGDAEDEYQDDKKDPKPDEDSVEDTIEKVVEGADLDDILLDDEEDENIEEGKDCSDGECGDTPVEDAPVEDEESKMEKCNEEGKLLIDSIEDEIEKEKDKPVKEADEVDSIEDEIEKEKDKPVKEAGEVDADVADVDDSDFDGEDDVINAALGTSDAEMGDKYAYDVSDEDIIDLAINGDQSEE